MIPLLSKDFWYQSNSEKQEGAPTMFFGNLGQKNFDGKTWHPPFYPQTFSVLEIFWKTNAFHHEVFRYCETKRFPRKIVKHPYLAQNFFGCPKFFESLEGSPQIFQHCETKTIDRTVMPLLSKKIWNKNNTETQTGSPTMIFGDVRQKNWQNCDTPII